MFEEGEEEGRELEKEELSWIFGAWKKEKKKKKKGKKERRKKIVQRKSSLKDSSTTWILSPSQLCQHTEIESKKLELLQELESKKVEMLVS